MAVTGNRPASLLLAVAGLTASAPACGLAMGLGARGRGLGSLITSPPAVTGISSAAATRRVSPSAATVSGGSGSGDGAIHRPSRPLRGRSGCMPLLLLVCFGIRDCCFQI